MITDNDAKKMFETGVRQELEGYVYDLDFANTDQNGINGWVTTLFLDNVDARKAAEKLEQNSDCYPQPYMNEEESESYHCEFDKGFIEVHLNFETNQAMIDGWNTLYPDELTVEEAEQKGTDLGQAIKETVSLIK